MRAFALALVVAPMSRLAWATEPDPTPVWATGESALALRVPSLGVKGRY